jgi:hypothetical protein
MYHQLLLYADDVNIMSESTIAIQKNTKSLLVTNKEFSLEGSAEKIKYMLMPQEQNARQYHNIKVCDKSFDSVEHFKHLGTTLKNQNCIHKGIKSSLNSRNVCYHMVQNLLFSYLVQKRLKL